MTFSFLGLNHRLESKLKAVRFKLVHYRQLD